MNDPRFDYLAQNRDRIEKVCIESVQKAVNEQATDPIARVGELLLLHSPDPSTTPPSSALRIAELEKELATTKTELATANARIVELEAASDDTPLTFTYEDVTMFFLHINSWNGTAHNLYEEGGIIIAGKTGTAQIKSLTDQDLTVREEYEGIRKDIKNRDHALFASYGPVPNPNLVVVVIVENGESGSAVAAPIAKRLIEEYQININES